MGPRLLHAGWHAWRPAVPLARWARLAAPAGLAAGVLATPYHGRSGDDGRVRLDAPAAACQLQVWHPDLPMGTPAVAQALPLGAPS
jgi:hypothetical protein